MDTTTLESELEQRQPYRLSLYVTGMSPRSTQAVAAIKSLCETLLPGNYELEVIDLYAEPARASQEQVIAVPTLVKRHPLPLRRMIGNLGDRDRVLRGLSLQPA
jgi:circadian clock protein KaiB